MAKLSLQLVESDAQITKKIQQALLKEVDKVMGTAVNKVVTPIRNLVKSTLMEQPEVKSLDGGILAAEFGLPDGGRRIEDIIDFWVSNIIVSKKKATASRGTVDSGLTIKMIQRDFQDVLNLSSATITTEKGQELPWLEWLLKFGDRVIVRDYQILFSNTRRTSRSGSAIMIKSSKGSWGVPSAFAGTIDDNFVTRALEEIEDDIVNLMQVQLERLI
jgi:hypothetical protein